MINLWVSWQFWALLAALFAALTAVFAKVGVSNINSDFATFFRTIVVAVGLGLLLYATRQFEPLSKLSQKSLLFLTLSGLATGASWLCYFRALQLGNASQVAPVDKLSVVFIAIIATIFLGEKLSAVNWVGIFLLTTGIIMVALK